MPKLTIQPSGQVYPYEPGKNLLQILLEKEILIDNPCGGLGICGKCRVKVLKGALPPVSSAEETFLGQAELQNGLRLACYVKPDNDLKISLLQQEGQAEILATGYVPKVVFDCGMKKLPVQIETPALRDQTPLEKQIKEQTNAKHLSFSVLTSAHVSPGRVTAVKYGDEIIQLEEGDTRGTLYGVAIDIGTTTVICALVDMNTGDELAQASMLNAQKAFGLDVLTRITYELEHPGDGITRLQVAIVGSINEMLQDMCRQAGIQKESIYELCVSANCTMMHMLLGVDAVSIGKAPYAPVFVEAKRVLAGSIGIQVAPCAYLYCLPAVSAYIGADIVAGAYVCRLQKEEGNVLFIDIGTNGEIVLASCGKLLTCSCAAGPALECMNISAGMRAADGAIEDVRITEHGITLSVIGNGPPVGVCGSGILAIVRELLKSGLIRKEGAFIKTDRLAKTDYRRPMLRQNGMKREFILSESPEKLLITQSDVRQVQLAKGAILSGFIALLRSAGIHMRDLDKVMIAGQFGAHLPADSLMGTGILPKEVEDKLFYVGNSSKTGAYLALMSQKVKREMEALACRIAYLELGATEGYERLFSDCLIFPEPDAGQGQN